MLRIAFIAAQFAGIVLLVLALADNPTGYYQLLRIAMFAICAFAVFCANRWYRARSSAAFWIFAFAWLAILFNPFYQVGLPDSVWKAIDLTAAIFMLAAIIFVRPGPKEFASS